MLLLRNCAKLFCMNELEACKVLYLIKEIGWAPSQLIRDNISNFTPPAFLLDSFIETMIHIRPLFVNLMLICFTAKMLLNDRYVVKIIQMWIECKTFPCFGDLFNRWIKQNESYCSVNLKKLNKIYTNSLQCMKGYNFMEHRTQVKTKNLEYQQTREVMGHIEDREAPPMIDSRHNRHPEYTLLQVHREWAGSMHDRDTSNRNTRKNSITSQEMHSMEPSEICGLERGQSMQTNYWVHQRSGSQGGHNSQSYLG